MTKIAVLDDYQGIAKDFADWSRLEGRAEPTFFHDVMTDHAALVERLRPFEIVCLMRERTPFSAPLIKALPNLKLIVTTGPKNASIDVAAAKAFGVAVCGTPSSPHAAAELAFALVMALARRIPQEADELASGGWQRGIGRDLQGATLGLAGLGRLGGRMAGYGQAFGMEVIAWSENLTQERSDELGVRRVSKEALFRESDFLSIHLQLGERSKGLVGREEFRLMKPDSYLINTSRGPIVQEAALVEALQKGEIAGAGLDVYDIEPLPSDSPLRSAPNILALPHVGYVSRETYEIFYSGTLEAIEAYLSGALIREINPA